MLFFAKVNKNEQTQTKHNSIKYKCKDYKRRIEMSTKKSSSIWEHFTIDPANCTVAVCNVCDKVVIRLSGSGSGLTAHLLSGTIQFGPDSIIYNPVHPYSQQGGRKGNRPVRTPSH